MIYCSRTKIPTFYLIIALLSGAISPAVNAADYYFRPTNLAMLESWSNDLNFTVSNPSKMPIVLKLTTRSVGVLNAGYKTTSTVLKVFPATMVVMPGERKTINLEYEMDNSFSGASSYEVVVEQLPILYVSPGRPKASNLMTITRYTAEIEIRGKGTKQHQYAFNQFGKQSDVKRGLIASAQSSP